MVDATQGLESQDAKILNDVLDARKGAVLVVNKWDLVEKETMTAVNFEKEIKHKFKSFDYVPVVFISAETKQRHTKPVELALKVNEERNKRIPTGELNGALLEEIERT